MSHVIVPTSHVRVEWLIGVLIIASLFVVAHSALTVVRIASSVEGFRYVVLFGSAAAVAMMGHVVVIDVDINKGIDR